MAQNHNMVLVRDSVGQEFGQESAGMAHYLACGVGRAQSHAWSHLASQLRTGWSWRVSVTGLLLVWAA